MIQIAEAGMQWRYETAASPLSATDLEIRALRVDPGAYVDALTERLLEDWWDILRRALASEVLGRRRLPVWATASFPCRAPLPVRRPLTGLAEALEHRARSMVVALA